MARRCIRAEQSYDKDTFADDMIEAQAVAYRETLTADDYEYQLAVHALPRLIQSPLLTDNQRYMLHMRYDKGMSQKAIAAALGVAPVTVSKSLKAARRRIGIIYAAIFPRFDLPKNGKKNFGGMLS